MLPLDIEWTILEWFYSIQIPFLDWLFWFITQLGGIPIIIGIMGIIYWCYDKEKGEKMGIAIILSLCINNLVKGIFNSKRPFEYEERNYLNKLDGKKISSSASGSSFPSGHSQNAATVFTSLAMYFRKKWLTIVSVLSIVLVMISRLYLGVHFPRDVIVGAILGISIAIIMYFILKRFYRSRYLNVILVAICLPGLFLSKNYDFFRSYGLLLGFVSGIYIEKNYINFTTETTLVNKIIRLLLGVCIVGIIFVILHFMPERITDSLWFAFFGYGIVVFIIVGIIPFLFKSARNPKGF